MYRRILGSTYHHRGGTKPTLYSALSRVQCTSYWSMPYSHILSEAISPTILEEDATSQNERLDNYQTITTQFVDIPNVNEPVSLQATDESKTHNNGDKISPIVSQTQAGINGSYADSDHEGRKSLNLVMDLNLMKLQNQMNNELDDIDDYHCNIHH